MLSFQVLASPCPLAMSLRWSSKDISSKKPSQTSWLDLPLTSRHCHGALTGASPSTQRGRLWNDLAHRFSSAPPLVSSRGHTRESPSQHHTPSAAGLGLTHHRCHWKEGGKEGRFCAATQCSLGFTGTEGGTSPAEGPATLHKCPELQTAD